MCRRSVVLLCLSIILVTVEKIESFSEDYYFRSNLDCDTDDFNFACSEKCKTQFTCMFGRCFCLIDNHDKKGRNKMELSHNNVLFYNKPDKRSKVEDISDSREDIEYDYDRTYSENRALRHHIAHFCENLDSARECIRTCIKQGKPAFCGKDHNCYCGHRYPNSHPSNKPVNPDDMYSAFKDLYERYFGVTEINPIQKIPHADSDENEQHSVDFK